MKCSLRIHPYTLTILTKRLNMIILSIYLFQTIQDSVTSFFNSPNVGILGLFL